MPEIEKYRYLNRRGTKAALESRNEKVLDGENVLEKERKVLKIGDGSTNYNDLEFQLSGRFPDFATIEDGQTAIWDAENECWAAGDAIGGAGITVLSEDENPISGSILVPGAPTHWGAVVIGATLFAVPMFYVRNIVILPPQIPVGIRSWYKLNETSGSIAYDSVGGKHGAYSGSNLTLGAAPIRVGSSASAGFSVSGAGTAQVNVPDYGNLFDYTKSGTFVARIKWVGNTTYNWLFASWYTPSSGTSAYRAVLSSSQAFLQVPHNINKVYKPFNFADGASHQVAFVKDGENWRLHIDGVLVDTNYSGAGGGSTSPGNGLQFPGASAWIYYGFIGFMSDVMIWERALSSAEISALYDYDGDA